MSRSFALLLLPVIIALLLVPVLVLVAAAPALAKEGDCGAARIIIEGGDPSPFILPDHAGATLRVDPQTVLALRAEGVPSGTKVSIRIAGVGVPIEVEVEGVGERPVERRVADYARYARGLYKLEGTLLTNDQETVCAATMRLQITGFGGVVGPAAAAAAVVAGVGSVVGASLAARGARVKLKVQMQRRRRRGWRRWFPAPAWKRRVVSTLMGAFTGLAVTVVLQQSGAALLSMATAIWGAVVGGGVTFGVGYSWGALLTYLRPPIEDGQQP